MSKRFTLLFFALIIFAFSLRRAEGQPPAIPSMPAMPTMATPPQPSTQATKVTPAPLSKDPRSPFANQQAVTEDNDDDDDAAGTPTKTPPSNDNDSNNDDDDDSDNSEQESGSGETDDQTDPQGDAATAAMEDAGTIQVPYIGTINLLQVSGVDPNKIEQSVKGTPKSIHLGPLYIHNVKAFKTKDGDPQVIAYGKLSHIDVKMIMKKNEDGESIFDVYPKTPLTFHITPKKQISLKKFELTLGDEKFLKSSAPIDPKNPKDKIHFTIMLTDGGDAKAWVDTVNAASMFGFSKKSHFAKLLLEKLSLDIKNLFGVPELDLSCLLDPTHLKKMGLKFKKDEKLQLVGKLGMAIGIDLIADITDLPLGHHGKIKEAKLIIQKSVQGKPLPPVGQSLIQLTHLGKKIALDQAENDDSNATQNNSDDSDDSSDNGTSSNTEESSTNTPSGDDDGSENSEDNN
jgi:hypothetical protein